METIIILDSKRTATLTTARPESSYGMPVLVLDGVAYGQADVLPMTADQSEFAQFLSAEDYTARGAVMRDWKIRTGEIAKLPTAEYNLIAKFIGLDLAHD